MKIQVSALLLRATPALALALGSGCMLSPYDGQVVADRSTPVTFNGFHSVGGRPINVRALNDSTGVFDTIDTITSSVGSGSIGGGQDMHQWYRSGVVIPNEYWDRAGCRGYEATIQARDAVTNYSLISVEEDWGLCWEDVEYDVGRFVSECAAPNSPNAIIRTADFLEQPPASQVVSERIRGVVYDECGRVEILFGVEPGRFSQVQAAIYNGINTQHLSCTLEPDTGNARCLVEFGPGRIADSWEDFINAGYASGLQFSHRGLDQSTCTASSIWTEWPGWGPMDGFGRDTSSSQLCFSGGPDEPMEPNDPDAGTWWDIGCICQDPTATVPVQLDSCFQVGVSSPATGASLMCGYAANHLEWLTSFETTCVLDSFSNSGSGPCMPGNWSVESIGS